MSASSSWFSAGFLTENRSSSCKHVSEQQVSTGYHGCKEDKEMNCIQQKQNECIQSFPKKIKFETPKEKVIWWCQNC